MATPASLLHLVTIFGEQIPWALSLMLLTKASLHLTEALEKESKNKTAMGHLPLPVRVAVLGLLGEEEGCFQVPHPWAELDSFPSPPLASGSAGMWVGGVDS